MLSKKSTSCHLPGPWPAERVQEITDAHTPLRDGTDHPTLRARKLRLRKGKHFAQSTQRCNTMVPASLSSSLQLFVLFVLSLGVPSSLCLCFCVLFSDSAFHVFLSCCSPLCLSPVLPPRMTATLLPHFQDRGMECGGVLGPTQPPDQEGEQSGTLHQAHFQTP